LVRLGHKVDLVTMGFRGLPGFEIVNGVRVHRVTSLRRNKHVCTAPEAAFYVASALKTVRRLTSESRYDINHAHFIFPDGLLAWSVRRSARIPYLITAHGSDVPGYNPHRLKAAHKLMAPLWTMVVRDAARIVCPSESLCSLVVAKCRTEKNLIIIPNGVDPGKFRPDKPKKKRILVVTRMLERKGVQYVLKALEGSQFCHEVHIVGDGPYLPALRQMALAMGIQVTFWGWLDNLSTELKELFETSSIYVLPSEAENFPIVLLEAMAAGMAIITTEGTGCAEVVGDAAILVPPKDPAAIRDAFSRLVSEPWRCRDLGQAARERLEENFSWPAIARRYIDQYRNIGGTRKEADPPQGDLAG
jgi:glycosyltransferase involved in cell wall biosynthesis